LKEIKKITSPLGNQVIDDSEHESWREKYYKRVSDARGKDWINFSRSIFERNTGGLNILGTRQVAEYYHVAMATAYNYMKHGVIPSFQVGRRWFTHDYVVDEIDKRARRLTEHGINKRMFPMMVWKFDSNDASPYNTVMHHVEIQHSGKMPEVDWND